jgi:hypothetical protein
LTLAVLLLLLLQEQRAEGQGKQEAAGTSSNHWVWPLLLLFCQPQQRLWPTTLQSCGLLLGLVGSLVGSLSKIRNLRPSPQIRHFL